MTRSKVVLPGALSSLASQKAWRSGQHRANWGRRQAGRFNWSVSSGASRRHKPEILSEWNSRVCQNENWRKQEVPESIGAGEGKLRVRPANVEMISLFARDWFPFVARLCSPCQLPKLHKRGSISSAIIRPQWGSGMASEVEKIMDEFEAALVDVLQASHNQAGASLHLRERLAGARANADKARAGRSSVENEYRAAVDRAFGTARQNFR
jgi:hypothetical protein